MPYAKGKRPSRAKPPEQRQKRGPKAPHAGNFQPGTSANPGGMPRDMQELRALMIQRGTPVDALDALEKALRVAVGVEASRPNGRKSLDPYAVEKLGKLLLEFAYGKPNQPVSVSARFSKMTDAEVAAELIKSMPPDVLAEAMKTVAPAAPVNAGATIGVAGAV